MYVCVVSSSCRSALSFYRAEVRYDLLVSAVDSSLLCLFVLFFLQKLRGHVLPAYSTVQYVVGQTDRQTGEEIFLPPKSQLTTASSSTVLVSRRTVL
jgi:hypothetical protein